MKTIAAALSCALLLACPFAFGQERSELTVPAGGNGVSQRAEVSQWIGPVKVSIDYHSPAVHDPNGLDRTGRIWGSLVPYGFVDGGHGPSTAVPWRAGANESTTITFSHDVLVDGMAVKAGTYALFLALQADGPWEWILSSHVGWGSFQYDSTHDVLRVRATPVAAAHTEYLTYGFDERRGDSALAFLQWEDKRVPLRIAVPDVNEIYYRQMREELEGWPGFRWQNWMTAARFCAAHKIHLDEALAWADRAIHEPFRGAAIGHQGFETLETKARVLAAMGRDADADALVDQAVTMTDADPFSVYLHVWALTNGGRAGRALAVVDAYRRAHADDSFWTHLGLARAYTAAQDKPHAVREWEFVLQHVPDSERADIPEFESTLRGLKGKHD